MKAVAKKAFRLGVIVSLTSLLVASLGIAYLSISTGETLGEICMNLWEREDEKDHKAHGK